MRFLKQSTAVSVVIGPIVDATDGLTPETGLDLSTADAAELLKHGSGTVVDISGATLTAITGADGYYTLALTAAHTDTLGQLAVAIVDTSLCRPVREDFQVLPANVYDSLFGADLLQVDVAQLNNAVAASAILNTNNDGVNADVTRISTSDSAANNLESGALAQVPGSCVTGSTVTSILTNLTETTNDHYNGRELIFTSGNLAGQSASISDYAGATKALTVTSLTEAPANGDNFIIV